MQHDILARGMTRRTFLGGAAALAAAPPHADDKPNSVIKGVRIGAITYSYRGGPSTVDYTLECLLKNGLSETELMDGPIRSFAGIGGPTSREEQLEKCKQLRKRFKDAGINIHIHKFPFGRTDEEIDLNFEIAKALGCKAITTERNDTLAKRLAPFAAKHKVWVAFHNHTNNVPTMEDIDPLMQIGDYIGFNLDIGHYVAGTKGKSPLLVIEKYHQKIISLHLKDRTPEGGNVVWGQGQTPIKDVLQLLKAKRWPIYADIELEYPVPAGSDAVTEVGKCLQFCREALA